MVKEITLRINTKGILKIKKTKSFQVAEAFVRETFVNNSQKYPISIQFLFDDNEVYLYETEITSAKNIDIENMLYLDIFNKKNLFSRNNYVMKDGCTPAKVMAANRLYQKYFLTTTCL